MRWCYTAKCGCRLLIRVHSSPSVEPFAPWWNRFVLCTIPNKLKKKKHFWSFEIVCYANLEIVVFVFAGAADVISIKDWLNTIEALYPVNRQKNGNVYQYHCNVYCTHIFILFQNIDFFLFVCCRVKVANDRMWIVNSSPRSVVLRPMAHLKSNPFGTTDLISRPTNFHRKIAEWTARLSINFHL